MSGNGKNLADWLREGRQRQRLSRTEAARRVGVSRQTWHAWETGVSTPQDQHYVGIEDVLRWAVGSVAEVLSGGEPTPLAEPEPLTEEQQQLMDVYHVYVRRYGPDEALRLLKRDVAEINTAREERARQRRPNAG